MKYPRIIVILEMIVVAALLLAVVYVGRGLMVTSKEEAIVDPLASLSPEERALAEARGELPLEVTLIDPQSMTVTESSEPIVVEDIDPETWEAQTAAQNVPDVISGDVVTTVENNSGQDVSVSADLNAQNEVLAGPVVVTTNVGEAGTTAVELQVVILDIDTKLGIIAAQERNSESMLRILVGDAPIAIGSTTARIEDIAPDDIAMIRGLRLGESNEIDASSVTITGVMSYFIPPAPAENNS